MKCLQPVIPLWAGVFIILCICSCKHAAKPPEKDVVNSEEQLEERVSKDLKKTLAYAENNHAKINDSTVLASFRLVNTVYNQGNYQAIWSTKEGFEAMADSLYGVVAHAKEWGLFPDDYHYNSLQAVWNLLKKDSASQKDAALWTKADVLLTEAYFTIAKHLKLGRLNSDSVTLKKDSIYNDAFFVKILPGQPDGEQWSARCKAWNPTIPVISRSKTALNHFWILRISGRIHT